VAWSMSASNGAHVAAMRAIIIYRAVYGIPTEFSNPQGFRASRNQMFEKPGFDILANVSAPHRIRSLSAPSILPAPVSSVNSATTSKKGSLIRRPRGEKPLWTLDIIHCFCDFVIGSLLSVCIISSLPKAQGNQTKLK
jgi:hypothetical protein